MSLLLDTHVFAWLFLGDPRLPPRVRALVESYEADIFVSAISAYEMAQKHRLGKWPEIVPFMEGFERLAGDAHFLVLNLTPAHAMMAGLFDPVHRDPFDRMIAAQSLVERLRIVSKDKELSELGAEVLWDR